MGLKVKLIGIGLFIFFACLELKAGYQRLVTTRITGRADVQIRPDPLIHVPLEKYNILYDQIVLQLQLTGTSYYTNIRLYYRVKGATTYQAINFTPAISSGQINYSGNAIIPSVNVTSAGIEYYIVASGPVKNWTFRDNLNPQFIRYIGTESLSFSGFVNTLTLVDGNIFDGETSLTINNYSGPNPVTFFHRLNNTDLPNLYSYHSLTKQPVMVYEIDPKSTVLNQAGALNLLYYDINMDGKEDTSDIDENLLKLFWYDGFEWRYTGGTVNAANNTLSANIFHFGIYALFPVSKVDERVYKPKEKILTPNGDGINDYLIFEGLQGSFKIKIINIRGTLIRTITDVPYWDCKDIYGQIVPGGVYFYQLEVDGLVLKGIFVIAK